MRGKQYSVIRKFSNRNLRDHKARNFLTAAIVMCITMLVCAMMVMGTSTYKNMERYYVYQSGNASQFTVSDIPGERVSALEQNTDILELGQSVYIGDADNTEFHGRPSELRYADAAYAEYMLSLPVRGEMPRREHEIAVDTSVLRDLNAEEALGTTITIEWAGTDGVKQIQEFEVSGIWEGSDTCPVRRLWVSEAYAGRLDQPCVDVAFNLKSSGSEGKKISRIADQLQVRREEIAANWVYSEGVQAQYREETLVYKTGSVLVLICGFLILYNIISISVVSDSKLYGRIKTLGATPRQIRCLVFDQYFKDALAGIPLGLVSGYLLGSMAVPNVIISFGPELAVYAEEKDFILTVVLVLGTVALAGLRPAFQACRVNPSDLLGEESDLNIPGKTHRRSPGLPALFGLSLVSLGRYRKRNGIAIALLTVGLVFVSCVYVVDHSFDISKYMNEIALSNITVTEQSLVDPWGEYDSRGGTITDELIHDLEATGGVVGRGMLYSQDTPIQVSGRAYENVLSYYEADGGEILQYMEQNAGWKEGFDNFRDTKQCMAVVFGIDHLVNDKISVKEHIIAGGIDQDKFLAEDYVIAQGYMSGSGDNELQPTYDVGDTVVINGREFEVMAVVDAPYPVTKGKVNPGSEFSMGFFMSARNFLEMFPENTPRKLFVNMEEDKMQEAETILSAYAESGVPVETENTIRQHYMKETRSVTLLQNLAGITILVIGIVNLVNVIVTSTTARKKEFAVMQSIGMTKKQLRCLLIMEDVNISVITLLASYFLSLLLVPTAMKAYLETQWTATYHFSILPLLVMTPFLVLIPVAVSIGCFHHIQKADLIERMQGEEG